MSEQSEQAQELSAIERRQAENTLRLREAEREFNAFVVSWSQKHGSALVPFVKFTEGGIKAGIEISLIQ